MPNWEELKKAEKGRASVMDGVPGNLPSLLYAFKVQSKAASVGFDWKDAAGAWPKIREELDELEAALAAGPGASAGRQRGAGRRAVLGGQRGPPPGLDPEPPSGTRRPSSGDRFAAMEALAADRRHADRRRPVGRGQAA